MKARWGARSPEYLDRGRPLEGIQQYLNDLKAGRFVFVVDRPAHTVAHSVLTLAHAWTIIDTLHSVLIYNCCEARRGKVHSCVDVEVVLIIRDIYIQIIGWRIGISLARAHELAVDLLVLSTASEDVFKTLRYFSVSVDVWEKGQESSGRAARGTVCSE